VIPLQKPPSVWYEKGPRGSSLTFEQCGGPVRDGSTKLVQTLIEHDLVDEFRVMIDPLVVGGGFRLFSDDGALRKLQLLESQVTSTGAIIATYGAARD
jgi:RibD C-terminal domain